MSFRQKRTVSVTHVVPGNRRRFMENVGWSSGGYPEAPLTFLTVSRHLIVSAQSNALSDSLVAANTDTTGTTGRVARRTRTAKNGTSDSGMSKEYCMPMSNIIWLAVFAGLTTVAAIVRGGTGALKLSA
jgi:hypothetical protein